MNNFNALFLTDGYKTGHREQYPEGTELVYSNLTPRSSKFASRVVDDADYVINFGIQYAFLNLLDTFDKNFFKRPKEEVCQEIKKELSMYLNTDYDVAHFEALHDLGYLPISVYALPEGEKVPIRVPVLTICNSIPEFYWITNFLETVISTMIWKPMTSATIAYQYKKMLRAFALKTDQHNVDFVDFQAHDFSMRGLGGLDSVVSSAMGHATSFKGSDSLPVIPALRRYYGAKGFVVGSVNATEHSVMCAGGKEDELGTFRRLLDIYPTGILSVVSDTWDLWTVLTDYLPTLKEEIEARDGKLTVRPDSGNPVDILCGDPKATGPANKGVVQLLWETFGGSINDQGYKVLNPCIGAIYGDSITQERCLEILKRLEKAGFASTNVVFGVGSFTYQYNTRDTYGFAVKATAVRVNGEDRAIFKDPITDNGVKKSAKGFLKVIKVDGMYKLVENVPTMLEAKGDMVNIIRDGQLLFGNLSKLEQIRERINKEL